MILPIFGGYKTQNYVFISNSIYNIHNPPLSKKEKKLFNITSRLFNIST